jgi:hypothetical protein
MRRTIRKEAIVALACGARFAAAPVLTEPREGFDPAPFHLATRGGKLLAEFGHSSRSVKRVRL